MPCGRLCGCQGKQLGDRIGAVVFLDLLEDQPAAGQRVDQYGQLTTPTRERIPSPSSG